LLDELGPALEILEFSGIGEPLMHSQFKDFASYARRQYSPDELKLQLVTNGSMLSSEIISFLVEKEFEQVWISLNAVTQETYSAVMPGLDFNSVKQSIIQLKSEVAAANQRTPSLFLTFVVTRRNYPEAEDFIELGITLGADRIEVRNVDNMLNKDIYDSQRVSRDEFESILDRIEVRSRADKRIGCSPKWAFWPDDFIQPDSMDAKSIYCVNARDVFGIYFSSGEVTPCCYMAAYIENPEYCLGNIHEESALSIWNGHKATALVESLDDIESAPDICKECSNYWSKQWISNKAPSGPVKSVLMAIRKNRLVGFFYNIFKQAGKGGITGPDPARKK
jgi:radical SAM protein with 4Fe4S-binding SPASM domain